MENAKQIQNCMTKQCDFCNRKGKCDREIEKEKDYGTDARANK